MERHREGIGRGGEETRGRGGVDRRLLQITGVQASDKLKMSSK